MSTHGISNTKILPYNSIQPVSEVKEILGCGAAYIFDNYDDSSGFSLLLSVKPEVSFKFGDFEGNELDIVEDVKYKLFISDLLKDNINKYIELLQSARVPQAQFYFINYKDRPALIDCRPFYNKFLSPGMLRDIISKCGINVPEIIDIVPSLNQEVLDKYKGTNFIVRPSSPKYVIRGEDVCPLAARMV